ncbi:hypothetical protein [Ornithinimicrobium murale]|uniref:hypothetical protein n=1 Tax=Ornithinimicrobium murale TaxID=1050153 RepID=UPI000E0D3FDE|nr:hypothetical protein [Ornithinimicrobium murale]
MTTNDQQIDFDLDLEDPPRDLTEREMEDWYEARDQGTIGAEAASQSSAPGCPYCQGSGTVTFHERHRAGGGGHNFDAPCPECVVPLPFEVDVPAWGFTP